MNVVFLHEGSRNAAFCIKMAVAEANVFPPPPKLPSQAKLDAVDDTWAVEEL